MSVITDINGWSELEAVMSSGCVSLDRVRVVYDTLPGQAIAAATIVDGLLWLVCDLDKASAPRHALAMLREYKDAIDAGRVPPLSTRLDQPLSARAPLALVS